MCLAHLKDREVLKMIGARWPSHTEPAPAPQVSCERIIRIHAVHLGEDPEWKVRREREAAGVGLWNGLLHSSLL